uniref:Transmembrane protein 54 n=1 Tax=Accipiter nisus TaxID=211598 RepID=A0A8B9S0A3_9AVES
MKTGLILLIIGHLNFITGALVHGTVLRFVVNPRDAISLQYAVANAASVISALLTISCGIAALVLSRCLAPATLKWAVFALSASSSLGCLSCLLGLAVSIGLTLGNQGRALLAPCTIADIALAPVSRQCPFDPTRVYQSLRLAGLLAGRPCGEPRPWAVPGLAEVGQRGNCPALSRTEGLMPWMSPGQPCPIPAPAQPHIGTWLLPSPAMGQTHPLDATSQDT